jgi:hypothetical protein
MDPNCSVTHNEKLIDRVGNKRQYDVVIRGTFAGRPMLGVMECRDHNRRKGPDAVDGFANKVRNLGADFAIIVSRLGFTCQALRLACFEKIACYSVASKEFEGEVKFGQYAYGIVCRWTDVGIKVDFLAPGPDGLRPERILYQGAPVVNWLLNELFEKHNSRDPGNYYFRVRFLEAIPVEVEGVKYKLKELLYQGTLSHAKKLRIFVNWTGDAFFEWEHKRLNIPANTPLLGSAMPLDASEWEEFDGEIPKPSKGILLLSHWGQGFPPGTAIPDLSSLNPISEIFPVNDAGLEQFAKSSKNP